MADYCVRGTAANGQVRFFAANTTEICETARAAHDTWPVATAALGRLLTSAVFFGLNIKDSDDTVTLRVQGDGPLGSVTAVASAGGKVKGYVTNEHVDIARKYPGKLDVGAAVGRGMLSVVKDFGYGEPYSGSVQLVSGEIGDDIARYFAESEQIPSAIGVGVMVDGEGIVKGAGGFLIQVMPGAEEKTIQQLELTVSMLPPVTEMIKNGLTPEEIAREIMIGLDYQILETQPIEFFCQCSRDRMETALLSLGPDELQNLLDENKPVEMVCRFCGKKHNFEMDELTRLHAESVAALAEKDDEQEALQ